jgi:AraC-like DNA-binding protein
MAVRKYSDRDMGFSRLNFSLPTKIALMSGTSLRTKFKKMYGTTLFEYFQPMLTQNARILLPTNKYSVKQLGNQPGYSNLSNVTIVFRKEFHHLPHKLIK